MSKKKIDSSRVRNKCPIAAPVPTNMDEMGYLTDDALVQMVMRLETEKEQVLGMGFDPKQWEVEIAYVRREQQIRNIRLDRHLNYMRSVSQDEYDFSQEQAALENQYDIN